MKILALELSSARGSLAVASNGNVEIVREWPNDRKNSGPFFEYLTEVQKPFGKKETIIVGLGPGSYAGTRIAISAAIGLQAASHARLIGFPSICAIECEAEEYCVIGDARRKSFERAEVRYPSAKVLAQLASDSNRNFAQPPLEPIYLREPHITIPKK